MDLKFHVAELLTILTACCFVIRAANRVFYVLRDFPPHRHINGKIMYPDGYEPPRVENLYSSAGAGSSQ